MLIIPQLVKAISELAVIIPEFIYTMVVSIFLYYVLLKICQSVEVHEKRRAKKFDL